MSTDAAAEPETWQPLAPQERRVLGVLVEKQKTSKTADAYPMTLNSVTTGCNQKSNRDPVMDLSEDDVEETLAALQKKLLVMRMTGSRVDRFRHLLYENWKAAKAEMAVLGELLLRGPQTKGELRGRAARMEPIDDDGRARGRAAAAGFAAAGGVPDRPGPPRRRCSTHGFHTPEELARARRTPPAPRPAATTRRRGPRRRTRRGSWRPS